MAAELAERSDRVSQLLARAARTELEGEVLITTSGLSRAEHHELFRLAPAANQRFAAELADAVEDLRGLLRSVDPFFVMSVAQDLNLFVPWGEYFEPTHEGRETRIELLAGLLATEPVVDDAPRPAANVMQAILDEVDHILLVSYLVNLTKPRTGDIEAATLEFGSTNRWMSIRGSSFAGHGEDLAKELYSKQSAWMARALGFTIDDVIKLGRAASELHAARRNAVGQAGADAANAELRAGAPRTTAAKGQAMARAMRAALDVNEAGLRDAATVTVEALCDQDPSMDGAVVAALLGELSLGVGSLDRTRFGGLFDVNPVRERPFLEYQGEYLLALPGTLSRDVPTLLEARLLAARPGFSKQRADTIDRLAVGYVKRMLPGAASHTHLHYADSELDGIVLFDRTAILIEGKATSISVAGQRGDVERLRRDVERAVEDASRQGVRAREYIRGPDDSVFTDGRGREVLRIAPGEVRDIWIVNPTLHELAGFAQQLPRLRSLGLFKSGEYPWSVFINDLRAIAETCESPAVFLHYLAWRQRLPLGERLFVTDEIDLWGSYLLGERLPGLADGGTMMIATASTDFDAYYDGIAGRGPEREPPRKFLPDSVREFVARVSSTRPPGWREAAGVCLDLSIPELAYVDGSIMKLAHEAARSGTVAAVAGRVLLAGIDPSTNASMTLPLIDPEGEDPTFAIACRLGPTGPELAWAQYRKPVTFTLSEYERAAFGASRGATVDAAARPKGRRCPHRGSR